MTDDEYRGTAPEGDEWRRFWKLVAEWDDLAPTLRAISAMAKGIATIKKLSPYILLVAGVIYATLNKDAALKLMGL